MLTKKIQITLTTLLVLVSSTLTIAILLFSYYSIFILQNQTDNTSTIPTESFSKITSINSDSISLYTNQFEKFEINVKHINTVEKFDPYTHENSTIDISELQISDHVVTIKDNQLFKIILMPPTSIIGIITELSPDKIKIISNSIEHDFNITNDTKYIDPNKQEIYQENIQKGNLVTIYSDYTSTDGLNTPPKAASIQVIQ